MRIVEFQRHNAPFVAGERAAFDELTAERLEKRGTGRIVGSVDDKGAVLVDDLAGGTPAPEPDPDQASIGPARPTRSGRQA